VRDIKLFNCPEFPKIDRKFSYFIMTEDKMGEELTDADVVWNAD